MRNFTFNWFKFIKPQFLVLFFLLISYSASAQFYTKHYIAPAPWQYFSKANEIVIATNSTTTVNITLSKSNGTLVTNLTAVKGTPAVYRFAGLPKDAPAFALNTILNGAGLIINANAPVSINLRNVASDALGGDGSDQDIKGNAALTSFGDAGIGIRFRVGYYRDGSLGNFSGFGDQRPIYSIMATVDNTTVKINNAAVTTLNAGQSYLFKAAIGTLVESSNPVVMNTSAAIDTPDGCGDGAFNQIPPESVLGTEYFIERGKGNDTAEQTTVVATKDNTVLTIDTYSTTGALVGTTNVTLATAGSFYTFRNGVSNTSFSASRVFADKKIVVYSGTAQSCEVDISTIAPVSECGGSNFIETAKFRNYGTGSLPYFGYILLRSATDVVSVNGTNIETISGIAARHQLGTTGWYIINFEDTQIGSPNILSISSAAKLTVSIVQQGGGFSMAGFFSNFAVQPEDPTMTYISGGGCTNNKAELTTPAGFAPYQWYFNGTAIAGANSSTYTATKTGAYSVASTLTCGAQTQSKPVSVTLCTDLGITKTVDNATPCIGSNVEFTIKVSNLGGNNISGVSVNDLLPSGYTYGSSTPSAGAYDSATGIWSIGDIDAQTSATLKIIASINASGNYTNTASLPSSIDTNTANNSASAAVTPKSSIFVVTNPATVCAPSTVDLTAPAVTAGSTPNMTLSYWTDANASVAYTTPAAVTTSGTYYIKAVSADGCQFIKPVVVTINAQAGTPTISASGSTTCATGSVVLTSSGNSGTYLWSTGETTKSITVTANGSYTVKRINAAGCPGNSSAATVVTFTPAAPTASAQTFCSSENKKVSDLVASGTNLKWYSAATGGTALPAAQALATGDYYASQTVSGCESSRTQVSVTINTTSSAPVAFSQTFCAADNKKVSDLVAAGTNLKWYNVSSGGTALPANQILTSGNYYVSQTANSCGESTRTLVVVTINTVPAAPASSSQTFCAIDAKKVSDLAATGTNLKWYNAATNGTLYTGTETLVTGTYYVSQSTNSCGESPRTSVAVTVNNTAAPTASSHTFCAIDAKKVSDLAASGTNLKWYSANTGGTLYTGTETLTSGNYYVSQTLNSCESTRTLVSVTVNNTPAPTASSQTFCAADAKKVSDLTATGTNLKWYSASTGGTLYTGTETLISANYYVSQTLTGCESARTLVSVTVNPTPSAPTITANGPTTFCSGGSVILTSSGGNSYLWSTGATTQSITVSASGNYSVRIANASGCQSAASAITAVTVNPIPAVPTLSAVTQPTCSTATGSFTISNYNASNTYAVSPSTGVTQSGNTITAPAGSYTVTASANGCTSAASSAAVINAQPATPAVPTLSAVTQPTCSTATGSFTISNYSASNTYSVSPSTGVTQSGNTITAPAGSYTVTAAANGCTSAASSAAVINAQPATPAVPTLSAVTQPTCSTATGSFTISNYNASNTYAVSPSTGVTQSGNTITAPAGSYTVTASANGCTSAASSAAVINTQPATPAVPTLSAVTQPTCSTATGSFTISNYNASNTYSVSPSTGVTQSGNTITAPAGSYTVTASANGCTSAASSAAVINAQPATPAVPTLSAVTQPTCSTATGSFTISNYNASNTYSVSPSTGVTQSGNTITAPAGSYTVTASANGCTSAASSAAVINAQPATPAVPTLSAVTQPTCSTATGSFTISNYNASNTYSVSPSTGVTQSGNTITAPAGSYTVTASANGCTSAASSAAVINAQPATPAVPTLSAVTQPTCSTATGSFTISNYSASNTYSVSPSTGVIQSGNTITAPAGSYTVTASANGCTSAASSAAVINAQPATPAVPTLSAVTQPTCSTATGSFTISNYSASNTYAVSPSTGVTQSGNTITAPAGSYTVTASANGCTSAASSAAVINAQPATPAVPTLSAVTQPTCSTATGSFTISNYNASNTYAVSPSTGVTQSGNTITAPAGSYTVTASANGCTSAASSAAVINAQPATPAVPTLSAVTQPTCSTATGSFTISNYNASNTYAVSPSTGVTQSGNTITAPAGSYTVTASANGCTSAASSAAVINAQPATPAVPTLSAVTQPTCSAAAGSFTISNYSASNTYAVSPSTGVTQSGNTITAPAGSYTVTASANGCTSAASSAAVINAQPATPAVPTLSAVTQPTCSTATGSFTISNYNASNTYSVSPSTGVIQSGNTITAPAGSYTVTAAANGCTSAASSAAVISEYICAEDDTPSSVNGLIGGTISTIFANDKINGASFLPGDVTLTTAALPAGITFNSNGTITVAANTAAGTHNIVYTICKATNSSICDSAIVTIIITAPIIDAVTETTVSVNGNTGGTTAALTANDTLNGNPVVIGTAQGNVTITAVNLPSGLTLNTDGTVTVAANIAAGIYDIEYRICEVTNPSNCDAVISKITVTAPIIDAVTETTASVNGNTGGTTTALTANDSLNGNPVVIGNSTGQVTLTAISVPAGLTLNTDGTVTVAANTAAGTYDVEYRICEVTNPSNCDAVISKVTVGVPVIDAVTETTASINGNTGGTTAALTANDTLNGNPVVIGTSAGQVTLTAISVPAGLTVNADGTVTVAANTAAGTYDIEYRICEVTNPSNCDAVISKVTVGAPVIDAVTETTAVINGNTGGTTAALTANDTLNGNPVVIGTANGNVTLTPISVPAGLTLNADGTVTVAANTAAGTYDVEYSICEVTNPANCDAVISKVTVTAPIIDAVTETTASVNGNTGGTTAALTANDTLNGNPVVIGTSAGQVTLTAISVPAGLTLNADGTVTVAANTAAGTYDIEYSICEVTNPANCDAVISKITVAAPVIDAVTETTASVNGNTGGTTAALTANDTLNGNPVVIGTAQGNVTLTAVSVPAGLTLNADGTVTVAANTAAGTYDVEYRICEVTNPTNCDAVISKVTVGAPIIDAVTETTASVNGNTGGTTAALTANDTLNGNPVVIGTLAGQITLTAISVPAGLTLNADGTVTVAANTAAGTYDVEYSICEVTNPSNCDAVISKVTVAAPIIDAVTETTAVINGNTGGTTTALTANDTLNGNPVVIGTVQGNVTLTPISVPAGLTLNADGTVTVAANTAAGIYDIEYSICEVTNPSNCDAVISKITVTAPIIDAVTETTASVNGNTGGTTAALTANDTLNGNPVVIGTSAGQVTLTAISVPAGLTLNADGTVTVAANTAAGIYDIEYSICEVTNPSNCDAVISKITVTAPIIDAVTETTASLDGNTGGTTAALTANDTLNGNPVVIGTAQGNVTLTAISVPAGLTLNADGTVTVAANTAAGTYDVEYRICEVTNPTNCDAVISKVVVTAATLIANADTIGSVTSGNTAQTLPVNVFDNDTKNGTAVVPSDVNLTTTTADPSGYLVLNPDGSLTLGANAPAGTYTLTYTICEKLNPSNCSSNTVSVTVGAPVIDAVTETTASVNGNTGGTTTALTANDTLNGNPVVIGTAQGNVTLTAISVPAGLTLNADGTVTVAANTAAGTYDVEYSICEVTNPSNCDAVISKVVVTAASLIANADTIGSVTSGNTAQTLPVNVFDNDTKNGTALIPSDVNLTVSVPDPSGYLVLNPDGSLKLGANAPAGTYTLTYTICEKLNPSNCSSNAVSVTVGVPVIDAVTETTASINGNTGGTIAALTTNDTLNGNPVVIGTAQGNVTITAISVPAGLTLNADGTVTVAANTAAGTYDVEYRICEVTNPSNCDAVISKVVVTAATLIANADTIGSVTSGNTSQTLLVNVFDNDTKNGTALVPSDVNLTVSVPDPSGYLVLNPDGSLTLGANAPAGTYTLTYTICEKLNPSNCSSNTVSVTVGAPVIDAVTETTTSINGNTGGTTAALTTNDTLNGNPVVIGTAQGNVTLTAISVPAGLTLNADGTVTVATNTAAGIYDIEYRICEVTNPANCDAVISKVVVTGGILVANADTIGSVTSGNTAQTLPVNVFDNDTKNGTALIPSDVNLTTTTADPSGYLILNPDGSLTLGANAPAGTYTLTYTICEKLNPSNCSSNTVSVTVGAPVIDAVTETTTSVNGNTGGTTAALTANDTLNGNPVVIGTSAGQVTLTAISVPSGLTLNADGTVTVAANTAAGTYDVEYSICEVTNPSNCDAVISKVVVTAATLIANADTIGSVTSGNTAQTLPVNVFDNDTKNGTALVPSDVNLTVSVPDPSGYLVLNPDGSLTLGANAPAGTYTLTYTICEKLNPSNCSSNTVSVTVGAPVIDAVTETTASVNGNTGGTTTPLTANDTLNGNPVVIGTANGNVTLTAISVPAGLTLNADGTVTVAANTAAGTYDVEYRICEVTNPANCDAVISKVVVTAASLIANADTIGSVTSGNTAQTLPVNVFDNDTKNGTALVPSDVNLTVSVPDPSGYLVLNPDGSLTLGANAPAGTYTLTYTICEKLNPSNCSSNTVSVTVGVTVPTPVIDAVTETTASVNGNTGGTTAALTTNDTLNGNPVVIGTAQGNVTLTAISVPAGLTLNADGTVTVAANTAAGSYDVEYSICEVTNPANCDAVISKVVVTAASLIANADTIGSVTSGNTAQTLPVNVFDNDTKNGTALIPSDVNLTTTIADPTGYLVLNPDGSLTLGANAPAGTYTLTYTICEKLNPSNCSSNTVSVTVAAPVIDAVTETTASVNGNLGGTTAALTANDTLNGNPVVIGTSAGQVTLTPISVPSGLTLNADGTVTVAANTAAGTYDVEYSICEVTNPANCDAVISKVVVTGGVLVANADTIGSVTSGNTAQTLPVNVFDNDTKNGTALVPSDVNLTVSVPDPSGYLVLNPDGSLTLGANAPAGTYTLTYTICEKLNPSNCSSNTVSVTVAAPVIDAVTETTASVNGNLGGTTAALTANDTLNGNPVVIGTSAGQVTLTPISVPAGLTLNADGTVTVAPNTAAGTYDVEYRICEVTNPSNCDAVISKVVVTSGALLQAIDDIVGSVVGVNHPQTVVNVFDNDTNNGLPVIANTLNLSVVTPDPTGFLTLNPDGTVTLGASAPRGDYTLTYTICEKLNPTNCSTASVKVTVDDPTMTVTANSYCSNNVPYVSYNVVADNFTPTNLLTIQWLDSANKVVATQTNLPLSGNILWPGAVVDGSGNGLDWPGWVNTNGQWTQGPDGFENTRPAVTMVFSLNPTVNVSVNYPTATAGCNARPTFEIKANNDTAGPIDITKGTSTGINVFTNDTHNGSAVIPANVILSTVLPNANLILNADGTVYIKPGTQTGNYQLTYQICDALSSSNCSQAVVSVDVLNTVIPVTPTKPIAANNDGEIAVDGINGSLEFINVLDNDLLDGLAVNPADVTITNTSNNTNFEFNADGTVNVKPNTPGGTYQITYEICEKAAATANCASATLSVFVEVPAIAIVKTAVFNNENKNNNADPGETITYKFVVTNTGNVPLKNITITDPLPGVIVSGQALDLGVGESNGTNFSAIYKITQTDINKGEVTNQASVKGNSAKGVVVEDLSDNEGVNGDQPTVITLNGCQIDVKKGMSPNGDGKNDRFYIQGIECYPDNTVEIYNRWGVLVFEKDGYNNEDRVFKGYSEGRTTIKQSDGLPAGTYFYILKYKDSGSNPHEKSGYLYINK